jgi:penicillin-binding protein 2
MAHRFGLGHVTGIELPGERAGQVPSRRWKNNHRAERWFVGDTINSVIGQGFILSNPLQLCTMTSRIANGGYAVEPRIIKGEFEEKVFPKMEISEAHMALMRRGMFKTVNDDNGTGHTARFVHRGARMSGKTGTTQVRSVSAAERAEGVIAQSDLPWHLRNHALFVGYAPADKPRYAVSVLVEHGASGSGAAAPLARDIMRKTLELGVGDA